MIRRPPRSTRTDTLFPYTTLFRSTLVSSALTRELFGYSFSTWRLHLRGSVIRSPRDIGRLITLTAGRIMRTDWVAVERSMSVADFRAQVPLGKSAKAILVIQPAPIGARSEERRVGKAWGSTG